MKPSYENLIAKIEKIGRFESLVQLPAERVTNSEPWAARGTIAGHGTTGYGFTATEALEKLLETLSQLKR